MTCGGEDPPPRIPSTDLELARALNDDLKAELERERRMRCEAESASKALARELAEERRAREAAEGVLRRLDEELAGARGEARLAAREMEEERRMLKIAEIWREERVRMKLVEAKLVMEEKLQDLVKLATTSPPATSRSSSQIQTVEEAAPASREVVRVGGQSQHGQPRREVENPHIRRGIKGFVEFPRPKLVKTAQRSGGRGGSREGTTVLESNLECQRAQLRILSRNKNPNGLMGTSVHFVT